MSSAAPSLELGFLCDPSSPDRLGVERPCGWWVFCYGAVFSALCVLGGGGFLVLLSTVVGGNGLSLRGQVFIFTGQCRL